MKAVVLLADNDPDYRRSLRQRLELDDYQVQEASSVDEARSRLETELFDLLIVDLRLSDNDDDQDWSGLTVAKIAAQHRVNTVVVTGFPSVETIRAALRTLGTAPLVDDYIPKTDGPYAVLHAIEVILGRKNALRTDDSSGLQIDHDRRLVYCRKEQIELSRLQYELLAYLDDQKGAVCSPEELIKAVYDEDVPAEQAGADRRLERLVERVREKIELDVHRPRYLIKVRGRGFRLDPEGRG